MTHAVGWRVAAVALFLAAAVLGWLAFTRFGGDEPPPGDSPAFSEYEDQQMRVAQLSVVLGIAAAFVLACGFACWERGARPAAAQATPPDRPDPPGPPEP